MFSMKQFNNACVQKNIFGTDIVVWFNLIVAVEKFGMKHRFNAIAQTISTGMERVVFYV